MSNYYEILNIKPNATIIEIQEAIDENYDKYRRLVTHHDPAVVIQANNALMQLERIRETLLTPSKKMAYDEQIENNYKEEIGTPPNGVIANPPMVATGVFHPVTDFTSRKQIREWWHQILGDYGKYNCYAFFLCLPSDTEAIRYLSLFGKELDILSGKNCLVIVLSKTKFKWSGHFNNDTWNIALAEQVSEGFSVLVAQLFKIRYTEFPCIVLFNDIRSPQKSVFTFKGLSAKEISTQIRLIFSLIQQASVENIAPVTQLERHQKSAGLHKTSQTFFDRIFNFTGKTFEIAMEAWLKTIIK